MCSFWTLLPFFTRPKNEDQVDIRTLHNEMQPGMRKVWICANEHNDDGLIFSELHISALSYTFKAYNHNQSHNQYLYNLPQTNNVFAISPPLEQEQYEFADRPLAA